MTIDDVKKELSGDEKMLASVFKAEKIYKKHKLKIFAVIAIVIAYFVGTAVIESIAEGKKEKANSAYLALEKNAKDTDALNSLKTNNLALFELFSYQEAVKTSDVTALKSLATSKNEFISDLSSYHVAVIEGKPSDSKFNGDLAKVHNAALLIKEGKATEAKEELELIPEDSPMHNISQIIKHYSIKGQ
ncbi:MAG TPA: hypothetical protein EYG94_01945 [Campylobacterales bacterium]|nr:hypothetical protein [Campylobacterales bacterium]